MIKDFLKFIFIEFPFEVTEMISEGDWVSKIVGILFVVLMLFIAAMILGSAFYLVDSSFRPTLEGHGTVTDKSFTPAHTTHGFIMAGKIMVPTTTHHPDNWKLAVLVGNQTDDVNVSKEFYDQISGSDRVSVKYAKGRLSNSLYIKDVSK